MYEIITRFDSVGPCNEYFIKLNQVHDYKKNRVTDYIFLNDKIH